LRGVPRRSCQVQILFQEKLLIVANAIATAREQFRRILGSAMVRKRNSWQVNNAARLTKAPEAPTAPNLSKRRTGSRARNRSIKRTRPLKPYEPCRHPLRGSSAPGQHPHSRRRLRRVPQRFHVPDRSLRCDASPAARYRYKAPGAGLGKLLLYVTHCFVSICLFENTHCRANLGRLQSIKQ
jgi:hypothetical protein